MWLAPLCLALAQGTTWTVDDDGPADFANLPEAVAAVADGDTLLVHPGVYDAFYTSRAITVLGPATGPKPRISGRVWIADAPRATLAGLRLDAATFERIAGRLDIDDCEFVTMEAQSSTLRVNECADAVLSRLHVDLDNQCVYYRGWSWSAVSIYESNAVLIDSYLRGPRGCFHFGFDYGEGGHAAFVSASHVVVAGSTLLGNKPGEGACGHFGCFACCVGSPGRALFATGASSVYLRGQGHLVKGWAANAIEMWGPGNVVVYSGIELGGTVTGGMVHHLPDGQPFLMVLGSDLPGETRRVAVFGEQPTPFLLLGSTAPLRQELPGLLEFALGIDPTAVFLAAVGALPGGGEPYSISFVVPPLAGLEGLAVHFQAFFPAESAAFGGPGMLMTNPAPVVFRF